MVIRGTQGYSGGHQGSPIMLSAEVFQGSPLGNQRSSKVFMYRVLLRVSSHVSRLNAALDARDDACSRRSRPLKARSLEAALERRLERLQRDRPLGRHLV